MIQIEVVDRYITAPEVWSMLLSKHPEVSEIQVAHYPPTKHGEPSKSTIEFMKSPELIEIFGRGDWPRVQGEMFAIGAMVKGKSENIHDSRTFIFVDLEYLWSEDFSKRVIDRLEKIDNNWLLFSSGESAHLVIPELVEFEDLPRYYGKLIELFSGEMGMGLGGVVAGVGRYLCECGKSTQKIQLWCDYVLRKFGHIDESEPDKWVAPVDLRYMAHSLLGMMENRECGFLRISDSPKYQTPPLLVAKKEGDVVFRYLDICST